MNEGTAFAVWRQLARRSVFEAFYNRRLSRSVVPDDQSQRGVELDGLSHGRAEGANSRDGELVDFRHNDGLTGFVSVSVMYLPVTLDLGLKGQGDRRLWSDGMFSWKSGNA